MQTEFELYNGPTLWARRDIYVPMDKPGNYATVLVPIDAFPAARFEVMLAVDSDAYPLDGWMTGVRAQLVIEGSTFGTYKPLTWFVDEPTDWSSGICRWAFGGAPAFGKFPATPPARYALAVRRSA
jgi:hypothetical protein